jgi:hypothetical protein
LGELESEAVTVKLVVAAVVGVPLSTPVALNESPRGSPLALQVIVPIPPLLLKVWEYGTPLTASGSVAGVVIASCAPILIVMVAFASCGG